MQGTYCASSLFDNGFSCREGRGSFRSYLSLSLVSFSSSVGLLSHEAFSAITTFDQPQTWRSSHPLYV